MLADSERIGIDSAGQVMMVELVGEEKAAVQVYYW